jgi:serine/threonine-protein kinase RsbT
MASATREETVIAIDHETDIVTARQVGREISAKLGFGGTDQTLIATAVSEIARNIVNYAGVGEMVFRVLHADGRTGLEVTASDNGPGIPDIEQAMLDGFSTGGSLGLGLPGARRLMDKFEINSSMGRGTTVTMVKWR